MSTVAPSTSSARIGTSFSRTFAGSGGASGGGVEVGGARTKVFTAPPHTGPGNASASRSDSAFFLTSGGLPTPVQRAANPADPRLVFDALLSGPTPDERARGLTTELTGVKQISVHELDGRALLVETIPPALRLPPPAFAQIYCTGLPLSGQTVLKISYLDSGATPYPPSACPGAKAILSSPDIAPPSAPASSALT